MAITSASSPAVDTGSCVNAPTDQRGFPRVGQCDIGAYEFASTLPDVTGPACSVVGVLATNPKQMDVRVRDQGQGLLAITNITVTNGIVLVPYFLPGSTLATVLAAVKINQASPTSFAFDAVDLAGNTRHCA